MIKQAVLYKLATLRLAINYVLRNRMQKQAEVQRFDMVYPGDANYDPMLGTPGEYRVDFQPYDRLHPPIPYEQRYPLRKGVYNLTSNEVSNPKVNPFLSKPKDLHQRLFGIPTLKDSQRIDNNKVIPFNYDRIYSYGHVPRMYYDRHVMNPLREAAIQSLFPDAKQIFKWGAEQEDDFDGTMNEHNSMKGYDAVYDTPAGSFRMKIPASLGFSDSGFSRDHTTPIESMQVNGYTEAAPHTPVPIMWPVDDRAREAMLQLGDASNVLGDMDAQASIDAHRYSLNARDLVGNPRLYSKHRSNLMHSYINQSPVGQAFAAHPSVMTGIPYAAYHAMPYLWEGNRPDSVNQAINTLVNGYNNLTQNK